MAVTLSAAQVETTLGVDTATATRVLATATALVLRFAPDAPDAIANEAALRCSGWLADSPASGVRRESAGPLDASYSPLATGALRASGAMSLLGPWKVRRAGAIAGDAT